MKNVFRHIAVFFLLSAGGAAYAVDAEENIKVFFNQPEAAAPSRSDIANPDKGIDDALVDFITSAGAGDKMYLCFYDMDNTKVINAVNSSSVTVGDANIYMIYESTDSSGIYDVLDDLDITNVITDGTVNSPLMHNKFAVIKNDTAQTGRVWTGSYNPTDNGTSINNNNAVQIESYALADIFADEFMYMWNSGNGKFSTAKSTSSNTAETVTVGDTVIEAYFAPYPGGSDTDTSIKIEDIIENATHSIFFCVFTFSTAETRIKEALKTAASNGIEVRGIVEADASLGVFEELREAGVEVLVDSGSGLLHHKFLVADFGTGHAKVLTGSYNWTIAARDANDENFLVISSNNVARYFSMEFNKNYILAGGISSSAGTGRSVENVAIYPSPARDTDYITCGYELSAAVTAVRIKFYTINGERAVDLQPAFYPGTYNEEVCELVNTSGEKLAPGLYIVKVEAQTPDGTFHSAEKFALIR